MAQERIQIAGLTSAELEHAARQLLAAGAGVARRVYKQVLRHGRFEPDQLGLGRKAQGAWLDAFRHELPEVIRVAREAGETGLTVKVVLRAGDGLSYECVLLPMGRARSTVCVSSQVGCKMGCRFCETGRMGLLRPLTAAEIVAQPLVVRDVLGLPFRNLVFMGMGEALDNPEALFQALRVLTDPCGLGLSQERITVGTVGRVEGIERLRAFGMKRLNLSVSLHAGNDTLRRQLLPIAKTEPLAELQAALMRYKPRPNFVLGVSYCLLPGINDGEHHAREVADFCRPIGRTMVNVIPYNPGTAKLASAPTEAEITRFVELLRAQGLPVRRRITKGRSLMAACGQLGDATSSR